MDSSVYIEPSQASLNFKIQERRRDNFPDTDFLVIADYNNVNQQDSTVRIELVLVPEYVQEVQLDTTLVKVRYRQ